MRGGSLPRSVGFKPIDLGDTMIVELRQRPDGGDFFVRSYDALPEHFSDGEAYAAQYGFGDAGLHRNGSTLLAAGQEIPRTHVFGHGVILGSRSRIRLPDDRFVYLEH